MPIMKTTTSLSTVAVLLAGVNHVGHVWLRGSVYGYVNGVHFTT